MNTVTASILKMHSLELVMLSHIQRIPNTGSVQQGQEICNILEILDLINASNSISYVQHMVLDEQLFFTVVTFLPNHSA
jgi:hypothetical protein